MIESCRACGAPNTVACERLGDRARCSGCFRSLVPLNHPHAIHSRAELDELVEHSPLPVVLDFWSSEQGAATSLGGEVERCARLRSGGAVVATVDTDEMPEEAARFGVAEVPTLIVFRRGVEEARSAGPEAKALLRAV